MLAIYKALGHSHFETSNRSAGDVGCKYSLLTVCGRLAMPERGSVHSPVLGAMGNIHRTRREIYTRGLVIFTTAV